MRTIETADVRRISVGTDGLSVRWMGLDRFLWCGCVVTGNGSGAAVGGGGKSQNISKDAKLERSMSNQSFLNGVDKRQVS